MRIRNHKAKPPLPQRKISEVLKRVAQKKRLKLILSILIFFIILTYFFVGNRGTYKLISFYNQKSNLEEKIEKLKKEKKELELFKSKLENDPEAIEKVAREKYKMKKKGEKVYQVVEK